MATPTVDGDIAPVRTSPYLGYNGAATSLGDTGEWTTSTAGTTACLVLMYLGIQPFYRTGYSNSYVGCNAFFARDNGSEIPHTTNRAYLVNSDGATTIDGHFTMLISYGAATTADWLAKFSVKKLEDAALDSNYLAASPFDIMDSAYEGETTDGNFLAFSARQSDGSDSVSTLYGFQSLDSSPATSFGLLLTSRAEVTFVSSVSNAIMTGNFLDSSHTYADLHLAQFNGNSFLSSVRRRYLTAVDDLWDNAQIVSMPDIRITPASASVDTLMNAKHWYGASWLYDGYQESPLNGQIVESDGDTYQDITIDIFNVPARATHINIYRGDNDGVTGTSPNQYYRLVDSIKLDSRWLEVPDAFFGASYQFVAYDDDSLGASYDALVGISETTDYFTPHWKLSASMLGSHFITDCYHPLIDDASHYLFRSKPGKFDQFDWTNDYLVLPERPTAIQGFNGRLYVWSVNNMYRINPEGMYIEDTYYGMGCISSTAVCVTDYGMMFASSKNIFIHDGSKPQAVGDKIRIMNSTYAVGWQQMTLSSGVWIEFDSINNAFVIFTQKSAIGKAFVYTLALQRWDIWQVDDIRGAFTGDNGVIYLSDKTDLKSLATSSTRKPFLFISRQEGLDSVASDKLIRRVRLAYTGTAFSTLNIVVNGSNATKSANTGLSVSGKLHVYDVTANNEGQYYHLYLTGHADGTTEIDAIEVISSMRTVR